MLICNYMEIIALTSSPLDFWLNLSATERITPPFLCEDGFNIFQWRGI